MHRARGGKRHDLADCFRREAIKQVFGGESIWRIEGSRMSHDGGAGADIYGTVAETDDGFCAARHAIISGRVEGGRVTWEEEPVPRVTEVVWPPQVREGRPCSEMVSEESIRLLSPVESKTLARLIDAAPELALDASLLLEDSASPSFVSSGQITTIEV